VNDRPGEKPVSKPDAGRLACERTFLAYERTQMAWVRTSLTLISFGFTIARLFEYLRQTQGAKAPWLPPRAVGAIMIVIGLLALVLNYVQHRRAMKILRAQYPELPHSLAAITAALLGLLGVLALIGAIIRG
jgi:putative membrane protein